MKFQTANAINLLLTAVQIRKSTCRHQRDGEKRGEREREEGDRGGERRGGEIVEDDHGAANLCTP